MNSTHYRIHILMKGHITKELSNEWFYLTNFDMFSRYITTNGRSLSESYETPIGVKEEIHTVEIDIWGLVQYGYEEWIEMFMIHIMTQLINKFGLEVINRTSCHYVIEGTKRPHIYIDINKVSRG